MKIIIYPFFKLYEFIFPDAKKSHLYTLKFILFALLIVGFLISGAVYASVVNRF